MKPADRALQRLRNPADPALGELARLLVRQTTATPLRAIASPKWIASQLVAALEAGTRGPRFRDWLVDRIAAERQKWREDRRVLSAVVPADAIGPLREVLRRPYTPAEKLTLRVLDQPALRTLVGEILVDVLHRFRSRVQTADAGFLGGLGQRAVRRGRGILGGLGENLGGVAGVAEGLVGAVKEEVEFAIDSKVRDFARQATADVIHLIARDLASPTRAGSFADMRSAVLDVLLDTPVADLASEAEKLQPEGAIDSIVAGIRSTLTRPDFASALETRIGAAIAATGDGTLGAWLAEVALEDVWTATTVELVEGRLRATAASSAFEAWWSDLHR